MKNLESILADYKPTKEDQVFRPYANFDDSDVAEWVNSAAGIDNNGGINE